MHPSVVIASYGYYLLAMYMGSLFNPANYWQYPPAAPGGPQKPVRDRHLI
jgi:hypothetical protein